MNRLPHTAAVILAAGKGERMKSRKAKVLHTLAGKPMLWHVLTAVWKAGIERVCVVVGFQAEAVKRTIGTLAAKSAARRQIQWATQSKQLGTAHALLMAAPVFGVPGFGPQADACEIRDGGKRAFEKSNRLLVICGDVPLVRPNTIRRLIEAHSAARAACSILTVVPDDPAHYGRIVRGVGASIRAIVEARDADAEQKKNKEVNSGIYVFQSPLVFDALREVRQDNAKREFYLTDVVEILNRRARKVVVFLAEDSREVLGINNRAELAAARRRARRPDPPCSRM